MKSDLCLEFQARARGQSKTARSWTARQAMVQAWEIKYKPCLDCAQGKEIAANGGEDDDVEELKTKVIGNEQTKFCRYCQRHRPLSDFYQTGGKYLPECKSCASARHKRRAEEKRAAKTINQIAPNKAEKQSAEAIKTQSIIQNVNKIDHKDIVLPMLNNDQSVNITNDITDDITKDISAPVINDKGEIITWADKQFKCRKCGCLYHGDIWAELEYVDDKTRVCGVKGCRGIVSYYGEPDFVSGLKSLPPILPGNIEVLPEKSILRTCERCGYAGPEDDFHIAGNTGRINVCRKCISIARVRNQKARAENTVQINIHNVILDFAEFPDLLETLTAEARKNFRTLQNEILYRVANHDR